MSPNSLLNWMLLSTVLLGVWWACYHLALRGERGFAYNRAYLVLGPLLTAGLPLLPVAWPAGWGGGVAALSGAAAVWLPPALVGAGRVAAGSAPDGAFWLWLIYGVGVGLGLARLVLGLGRLWAAARALPRGARAGYVLVRTRGRLPTSSFGRVVFWDETQSLSAAEARQVLRHELAHVRQRHTHDRLVVEVLRVVLWFNPFVHLCGRALALTHEYLADEAALRGSADPAPALSTAYARLLARQVAGRLGFAVPLAHTFSHSQTLTRIAMIQKTNPVRRWKQWLALPLLGVLLVAVACEKTATPAGPAAAAGPQNTVAPPSPPAVYESVEQMPELPGGGGPAAIVALIQQQLKYPALPAADRKSGRVFASFIVTEQGEVQAVNVVKGLGPAYDEAVTAAIQALPRFTPGLTRVPARTGPLQAVAVSFTVPILFAPAARPD